MKTLDLKVGTKCNNSCRHCVAASGRGVFPDRSLSEILEIMELWRDRCDRVVLTGGELTVRKDCFEIVSRARELGYNISVQTNARMFSYSNFTAEFMDAAGGDITVLAALLSAQPDVHNYLTSKESFHQTVAGMNNLLETGAARVDMNTVVTKLNYQGLEAHANLAVSLGVASVQYAFIHIFGDAKKNADELIPRMTEAVPFMKKAIDILEKNGLAGRTEAVPLCMLGEYSDCASEPLIPDSVIADLNITILDFSVFRRESGKLKGPACGGCARNSECEGPWREYPEKFGWDEICPVRKGRAEGRGGKRK